MKEFALYASGPQGLSQQEVAQAIEDAVSEYCGTGARVLLLVPDYTRYHSNAGLIANTIYHKLQDCQVELMPALGTHVPMSREECADMYGDIPYQNFLVHNWREDVVKLGEVPGWFVSQVSEGLMDEAIDVEVNRRILDASYDLILSIGQVVPHEVVGMANHAKNIFVGCGSSMINASHMLGAFYGMERIMGKDFSPVRKVFDYAAEQYLKDLPLCYIMTVTTAPGGQIQTHGLFVGSKRDAFEKAVALAQEKNLTFVDEPFEKVVVYLDPKEFKSTWLGNKAVYRTRMAIRDGGSLLILAPGIDKFGEDGENDRLIRKYGYCGREQVIRLCQTQADLQANLSVAAHLIHGSSDGRFSITYCTEKLSRAEVESVCYQYMPYQAAAEKYNPQALQDGINILPDGEVVYYISNPALGLWVDKSRF